MNIKEIYNESVIYGGEWLLFATGKLELTLQQFISAVEIALRNYNNSCPYSKIIDIKTGGYTHTFINEIPAWISKITPVAIAGLVPPIAYDMFAFEYNKQSFVWKYRRPNLHLQYPGVFNVEAVFNYTLTKVLAKTALTGKTGIAVDIHKDSLQAEIAQQIVNIINSQYPTIFTASPVGGTKVRIQSVDNGACTLPTLGDTFWITPITVVQLGTPTQPMIIEIECFADVNRSLFLKYLTINSPSTQYYIYFTVDGEGDDPIADSSYVFNMDQTRRDFYRLCAGYFLEMLGRSRISFTIANLEIGNSGSELVSAGNSLYKEALANLEQTAKYRLSWGG